LWYRNLRERGYWGDPDGRIILRWIFRKLEGGREDWMDLAQDRDGWRELSGYVKMRGISRLHAKIGQLLKNDSTPCSK
jgi:hypothetical protein